MRPQKSPSSRLKFWLRLILLLPLATYVVIILLGAVTLALAITTPLTGKVCCLDRPHENITFRTADGLNLAGWYIPPKNGALVILLHSYYANRLQTLPVAEMLARHGYGVLLYDQRASGESQGSLRSLGMRDIPDVAQALRWLQTRQVTGKIGVYGCSIGGAIALAATAENPTLAAVVTDAPSPLTFGAAQPSISATDWAVNLPIYTLYFGYVRVVNGLLSLPATLAVIPRISPRPILFISTGESGEIDRVKAYYELAGEPKTHWNIPNSGHCAGPVTHPDEYEQQLVEFFDTALLKP